MPITIRKANIRDAGAIAGILHGLKWFANLQAASIETTQAQVTRHLELCNADPSHSVYVAEDAAGAIAGYVSVHWLPYLFLTGPEGYISELFVDEAWRGNGIGAQLLETVKAEAKERGCYRLMLINNRTRESYQRAFYKKHGWEERPDMANFVYILEH
jgi:GNAT superfamily N-acetyltransferase